MSAPHISRRDLLLSAAALLPLRAQDKPPEKTDASFTAGVKVVNVLASVHNGKNEIVKDLTKDDFALEEDGKPQVIKYFSKETDLPLTLGLMVDTSGSQRRVLDDEKDATSKFISQVMREDKDKAFLIKFDSEAEEMQEPTSSKKKLQSALNDVQPGSPRQLQRRNDPNSTSGGGGGYGGGRGTILYDAILLASNEELKKLEGRKAMILLTDGDDHGSRTSLSESIESAQRADTIVYSIYFADTENNNYNPGFGGPGMGRRGGMGGGGMGGGRNRYPQQSRGDGKKVLQRISKETGGSFFEVTKKQTLEDIYQKIEDELRSQYNLGYTPEKSDSGAGFRKIKVTAKGKGLVVQAREGYYATT